MQIAGFLIMRLISYFYLELAIFPVYCAAGYEVNLDAAEACLPCERGYYKDNVGNGKFEACKTCGVKTTDGIAADKLDLCEYGRSLLLFEHAIIFLHFGHIKTYEPL